MKQGKEEDQLRMRSSFFLAAKPPNVVIPLGLKKGLRMVVCRLARSGTLGLLTAVAKLWLSSISGISQSFIPFCFAFSLKVRYFSFSSSYFFLSPAFRSPASFSSFFKEATLVLRKLTSNSRSLSFSGNSLSRSFILSVSKFFMRSMSKKVLAISQGGVILPSNYCLNCTISCDRSFTSLEYSLICSNSFSSVLNLSRSTLIRISIFRCLLSSSSNPWFSAISRMFSSFSRPSSPLCLCSYTRKLSVIVFCDLMVFSCEALVFFNFSLASVIFLISSSRKSSCFFSEVSRLARMDSTWGLNRLLISKQSGRIYLWDAVFWQLGQARLYQNCWVMQCVWKIWPQARQERSLLRKS